MTDHFDALETRDPAARDADLLQRLPGLVDSALRAAGWRRHLGDLDPARIDSRAALARLPVLRKPDLIALQKAAPPFGGFVPQSMLAQSAFGRVFSSPGPIYEPEGRQEDAWRTARALHAAGVRAGDLVLNTFSYHLTPGGFIFDAGARRIGCAVIPAGPGNTEQQLELIAHLKPSVYAGTPDFLNILCEAADKSGHDLSSIRRAVVSGAAFPPSLQAQIKARAIDAFQLYATADVGLVAYETPARQGMVVAEDVLLEIVSPAGDPLPDGEVGEVVITSFDPQRPWIRLALGDLSAVLAGPSPCGRTNTRIRGWMGRADQTTKVKGMFVRPEQVAEVGRRHPGVGRLRLVVTRQGEADTMTLQVECGAAADGLAEALAESLRNATRVAGKVELVAPGSLPGDGKVIEDRRGLAPG